MGKRSKPASRVVKKLALEDIALEGGTQSRCGLNSATVAEYADMYRNGEQLPEPVVFHDGEVYWLSSGFHRVAAARLAKFTNINCEVRKGGTLEAFVFGMQANAAHGLPRSHHDKRFSVKQALKRQTIKDKSDREVAKICCVSHDLVRTIRAEASDVNVSLRANDSAPVAKSNAPEFDDSDTSNPTPAPPSDVPNGGSGAASSSTLAIEEEGAGVGAPMLGPAGLYQHMVDDGNQLAREGLAGDAVWVGTPPTQRRDPGAPVPCPRCNPDGTSASGGWLPGKAA